MAAALACCAVTTGCKDKQPANSARTERPDQPAASPDDAGRPPAADLGDAAPASLSPAEVCSRLLPATELAAHLASSPLSEKAPAVLPPPGMFECHLLAQDPAGWIASSIDLFIDCRAERPSMTALRARAEQLTHQDGDVNEIDLGTSAVVAESTLLDQPSTTIFFVHGQLPCSVTVTAGFAAAEHAEAVARLVHHTMSATRLPQ